MKGILVSLLCLTVYANAQTLTDTYFAPAKGNNEFLANAVATPDGGYVLVGKTDAGPFGKYDIVLLKTDAAGTQQWLQYYGGAGSDVPDFVSTTPDGGYILCGYTDVEGNGDQQGFVKKIDPNGTEQWTKLFEPGYLTEITCARAKHDSGYLICGQYRVSNTADQNVFYATLNADGDIILNRVVDLTSLNYAIDIQETKDSGILFTYSGNNSVLSKYNSAGDLLWTVTQININGGYHGFSDVCQSENSAAIFVYNKKGTLQCVSADGVLKWTQNLSNLAFERLVPSTNEGVKLTYYYQSALHEKEYDIDGNLLVDKNSNLNLTGLGDKWRILVAPNGTIALAFQIKQTLGDQYDLGLAIAQQNSGQNIFPNKTYYGTSSPNNTFTFSDVCKTGNGHFLAVVTKFIPQNNKYEYRVLKTDLSGNVEEEHFIREAINPLSPQARIRATPDNGALIYCWDSKGELYKVDETGTVKWERDLSTIWNSTNFMFDIKPNGHVIVCDAEECYAGNSSVTVAELDRKGNVLKNKTVNFLGKSLIIGSIVALNDGRTLLQGFHYTLQNDNWSFWFQFLDADLNQTEETEEFFYKVPIHNNSLSYNPCWIPFVKNADGSFNSCSFHGLFHFDSQGHLLWNYNPGNAGADAQLEEVPSLGYVWAYHTGSFGAPKDTTFLRLVDYDGNLQKSFTIVEFPQPTFAPSEFVSGYHYREWTGFYNGVNFDARFRLLVFPGMEYVDTTHQTTITEKFSLFPNPSPGYLSISLTSTQLGPIDIRIFNAQGQLVERIQDNKQEASWSKTCELNLPEGTYVVKMTIGDQTFTRKWIKVR